jgi:hypothetical protein
LKTYIGGHTIIKPSKKQMNNRLQWNKKRARLRPLYLQFGQWSMSFPDFLKIVRLYERKYPNGEVAFEDYWFTHIKKVDDF